MTTFSKTFSDGATLVVTDGVATLDGVMTEKDKEDADYWDKRTAVENAMTIGGKTY